jgi:integrase
MPKITLAKGERQREGVLTEREVKAYLDACHQPWKDCPTIMLGTGMRTGEVLPALLVCGYWTMSVSWVVCDAPVAVAVTVKV